MNGSDIRLKALNGFRWTLIGRLSVQLLSWAATIQVLRLLTPEDYGINTMAMVVVGFGVTIADFGLTTAIVQARDLREEDVRRTFAFILLINLTIFSAVVVSAPLFADFFDHPELRTLLPVAAIIFPITSLLALPNALLERELRFKEKTISEITANIVAISVTLISAWLGAAYWSLVFGALTAALIRALWLNFLVPWPKVPLFKGLTSSSIIRFGGGLAFSRCMGYLYLNADTLIVGRMLGGGALGTYSVGSEIAAAPLSKVSAPITQVMVAAVSRLQTNPIAARSMAIDAFAYVSALSFPVYFGLANVSSELVTLLLAPKWAFAAKIIAVLSLVGPLRAASVVLLSVIAASGITRLQVTTTVMACVLIPPAIYLGVYFHGIEGAAWAWAFSYPIIFGYLLKLTAEILEVRAFLLARLLFVPCFGVLTMSGAIWIVGTQLPNHTWLRLTSEVVTGAFTYTVYLFIADRKMFMKFAPLGLFKRYHRDTIRGGSS